MRRWTGILSPTALSPSPASRRKRSGSERCERLTELLIPVADVGDIEVALTGGADRLGIMPAAGRPLGTAEVAGLVAAVGRRCPAGATLTALTPAGRSAEAIDLARAGVDWIEGPASDDAPAWLAAARRANPQVRGVVLIPAVEAPAARLGRFAEAGFSAARLTRHARQTDRLIDQPGIEGLARFVEAARRRGLAAWIGGGLEPPDVPRLLALAPDVLAVRASVSRNGARENPLDPARLAVMRTLIPARATTRPLAGAAKPDDAGSIRDRVFVRDYVVVAGIGAYDHEHRAPQRLRFNVEAELVAIPDAVADMRDIFSYDVIIDAIRLATRRHVLLVERIALDVAHATLRDHRVRRVRVRVEKLDIIEGGVGVEIVRARPEGDAATLASAPADPHLGRP